MNSSICGISYLQHIQFIVAVFQVLGAIILDSTGLFSTYVTRSGRVVKRSLKTNANSILGTQGPNDLQKLEGRVVLLTYINHSVNLLCCIPGQVEKTNLCPGQSKAITS